MVGDNPDSVMAISVLAKGSNMDLLQGALSGDDYHKRNCFLREEGGML